MPYRSKKQRTYMHTNLPEIAQEWDRKYGTKIVKSVKKKKRTRRVKRE